ncbi:MAG: methyltransferase domain-containing protein [Bryobacterales bacterium]|nr:methyltransferase domain-containing protein [Bryobacterales bacterium]
MVEFTGERIVPGAVDDDLLHEHISRYRFASGFATDKRCLDAGCGLGYGTAILAKAAATAVGVDIDLSTVNLAKTNHSMRGLEFSVSDVRDLPFADRQFDLSVSFEVVEHLHDWQRFLVEIARVTAVDGLAVISTPNRNYYAESRGVSGPNPFHIHEFDYAEYLDAMRGVFRHVRLVGQNVVPAISFFNEEDRSATGAFRDAAANRVADAQYYVALCSHTGVQASGNFVYIASSGNVLKERARHIRLLEQEVRAKTQWLERAKLELEELQRAHEQVEMELRERSRWAIQSTEELQLRNASLASSLDEKCAELEVAVARLHEAEQTVEERSLWARGLDDHNLELRERIAHLDHSLLEATEAVASSIARAENLSDQLDSLTVALEDNQQLRHREQSLLAEIAGFDTTVREPAVPEIAERLRNIVETSQQQAATLELLRVSRWLRLGRTLGIGPQLR